MDKNDYREKIIALVQKIESIEILKKVYVVAKTYYELLEEKRE